MTRPSSLAPDATGTRSADVPPTPRGDRSWREAMRDIAASLRRWDIALVLGWQDAVLPYRRSVLGLLWIVLMPLVWSALIVIVFIGPLAGGDRAYIAYVTAGIIVFQYLQSLMVAGTDAFTRSAQLVRNIPGPLFVHVVRAVAKHGTVVLLQSPLIIGALIVGGIGIGASALVALPSLLLVTAVMLGAALFLACVGTVIRDLVHGIVAIMRVAFFATPVFWYADGKEGFRAAIALVNPLTHLLTVVRAPLLGEAVPLVSWLVVLGGAAAIWLLAIAAFARLRMRIVAYL